MNYWATLLRPLWYRMGNNGSNGEGAEPPDISEDTETIVVICNRSGTETGATFAGSSSLFRLQQSAGYPLLLKHMSRRQEGVCVWTT